MFGRKQRAAQACLIAELEGRVAVMATTLSWYADPATWQRRATHQKGEPLKWEKSPAAFDRGKRARSALAAAHPVRHPAKDPVVARMIDRFISNATGEPKDPLPTHEPMAIDPLSIRVDVATFPPGLVHAAKAGQLTAMNTEDAE